MAFAGTQVLAATTATALVSAANDNDGRVVTLRNVGAASVFLGSSGVTIGTGYELPTTAVLTGIVVPPGEILYGIVAAGTNRVDVLAASA